MGHAVTEETWVRVSEPVENKAILLDFCCTPGRRPGRIFILSGLIPAATVTLLHVRTAPTPVGKVVALLHVRDNAAALQPHLSERGPGTAESGPLRPRMGRHAASRVL